MMRAALALGAVVLVSACAATDPGDGAGPARPDAASVSAATAGSVQLPPPGARFSYQIGGPYDTDASVEVIDRDHSEPAVEGRYSICYVNAFQSQPEDTTRWEREQPELLLRDSDGELVIDEEWNEPIFDMSTPQRRDAVATVVHGWIDECAENGYRAVELDNLDAASRTDGLLSDDDVLEVAEDLVAYAHAADLAVAQKNSAELTEQARELGFDFVVAEECQVYEECETYTDIYGSAVIEIEYTDTPARAFTDACRLRGSTVSVVLRDRDVAPKANPDHVERWCP